MKFSHFRVLTLVWIFVRTKRTSAFRFLFCFLAWMLVEKGRAGPDKGPVLSRCDLKWSEHCWADVQASSGVVRCGKHCSTGRFLLQGADVTSERACEHPRFRQRAGPGLAWAPLKAEERIPAPGWGLGLGTWTEGLPPSAADVLGGPSHSAANTDAKCRLAEFLNS